MSLFPFNSALTALYQEQVALNRHVLLTRDGSRKISSGCVPKGISPLLVDSALLFVPSRYCLAWFHKHKD